MINNKGGDKGRKVDRDQETAKEREVSRSLIKRRIRSAPAPKRIEKRKAINISPSPRVDLT